MSIRIVHKPTSKTEQYAILITVCLGISMSIILAGLLINLKQHIERLYKAMVLVQYLIELLALVLAKTVLLTKHQISMDLCF